jgi:glycopeptide antibiotics resistance protein
LVVLVLAHTLPLDLTISPGELYHKYREGRIQLIPFVSRQASLLDIIQKCLTNVAWFFPVGLLLHQLPATFRRHWLAVLGIGLGLAGAIEFAQLFVYTRYCDTTDIITGSIAVLAGWAAGVGYCQRVYAAATDFGVEPIRTSVTKEADLQFPRALWIAWLALLVFINWQPFDFDFSAHSLGRLQSMSFVPFADYVQEDYLQAFDQIASKITFFLVLGLLLPIPTKKADAYGSIVVVSFALVLTTTFEAGQLFLPSRYPSVTDVLIEAFGVYLGFVAGRRARAGSIEATQSAVAHSRAV